MFRVVAVIGLIVFFNATPARSLSVSLSGAGWSLWSSTASSEKNWNVSNVSLPGDVYLNLYESGKIPDPYYRDNDVNLRWISYEDWTYQRPIDLSSEFFKKKAAVLVADGVDTIANVYVNDVLVGNSTNMFRFYVYDIRHAILEGTTNFLKLDFFSPVNYSRDHGLDHKRRYGYSVPFDCPSSIQYGECHVNFIRKMQSHYSWDWGPAFPTMGVTGDLKLVAFDACFLKSFSAVPFLENGWILNVEFWLYCVDGSSGNVTFRVSNDELKLDYSWIDRVPSPGVNRFYKKVPLATDVQLKLWSPNGLGRQVLYDIRGKFGCGDESGSQTIRVGFRKVELIQRAISQVQDGATFYLEINEVPTFLKGSNWIPGDSFLRRLTKEKLEFYFQSMRDANMNCVRVWGGGVFESDYFYELADQYGITLWHDMMFAVDLYPATTDFLDNVRSEVTDQINRLKHHPSIVIWAGNNENELGLAGHWFPMDAPFETYKRDYLALYNDTIYGVVNATDFRSRPYVLSSPSNGVRTMMEGGVARDPGSNVYGDVHYYNYDGDAWDWKTFPTPRCTTEFGYQSYPSLETLRTGLTDADLFYRSPQMEHRQHHPNGDQEILSQISRQFDVKPGMTDKLENVVYLSQIHQAIAYKTEVEHYRRWRSMVNDRGEGLTMCALYWQLNDIWQAPTWASIDYGLKWKAAHYEAKRFFAPVLVSPYIDGENLKVVVANDLNEDLENVVILVDTYIWQTGAMAYQQNITLPFMKRLSSKLIFEAPQIELVRFREDLPVVFNSRILDKAGRPLGPNNILFPDKFIKLSNHYFGSVAMSDVQLEDPEKRIFKIKVTSDKISPFVWLDVSGVKGYFSDNAFSMVDKEITVQFFSWDVISLGEFKKKLTIKTLGDLYRNE